MTFCSVGFDQFSLLNFSCLVDMEPQKKMDISYLKSVLEELQLAVVPLDICDAGKVLRGSDTGVGPQRLQVRDLLREGVRVLSVALLGDFERGSN